VRVEQQTPNINALTTAGLNLIAQSLSIFDHNLRLVKINRPMQQMFNLPDAMVQPGVSFEAVIRYLVEAGEYGPVDDVSEFVKTRVERARDFKPHYMERTRANGRTISVEGAPLPQGGWVTVYTDITRTKEHEVLLRARSEELSEQLLAHSEALSATNRKLEATVNALEEAKHQLTEIEARTRLTTEMMPAHIAHVGPDGIYTYSNRRLNSVIPGRPSSILGLHISDALGGSAFGRIKPYLEKAYCGTSSVFEFTDKPSSRRIRAAFTPDGKGGVYILSMDVTEETQARVALQHTRKRELAAQMTSGLAHDFSNLLTIILGMQSKLKRMPLPDGATDLVDATLAAAQRGGSLLGRIGDMTGHRTLRPVACNVAEVLNDLNILAGPALPKGMSLNIQNLLHSNAPNILLDVGMVQDSLLNLILNARDACGAQGGIRLTVRNLDNTWIEFQIEDTGPGFSADALKQALDPFFTTKGSEGSGLGMSMVYDMTKLAGGDLRFGNTGSGAIVTLRLPYRIAPDAVGGLVLLVEDSDDIRANVRDMLIDLSHSVIEATSADEAIALAADLPDISMVLSDILIEGAGTGIDVVNRMRGTGVPCVLMTSLPPDHALHQQALSIAAVLRKPFNTASLAALLAPKAAE
jgi:signal transduction histidine kinase